MIVQPRNSLATRLGHLSRRLYASYPIGSQISQRFFIEISDLVFLKLQDLDVLNRRQLNLVRTIFVQTDILSLFLTRFGHLLNNTIILAGNSDAEFTEREFSIPPNIKALYLQNSFISDNKNIFTLPLGIEDPYLDINGRSKNLKAVTPWECRQNKILMGPLSPTHPRRLEVASAYPQSNEFVTILNRRMRPTRYARESQKYRFIAAVRGNGVDTHRFWESLYRGSIPVVEASAWSWSLRQYSLPHIEVQDFTTDNLQEEIISKTPKYFSPDTLKVLTQDYWLNLLKAS